MWENNIVLKVIQTNVHTSTSWLPIASCLVSSPIYHIVSWNHGVILLNYDDKNTTKALSQCLWSLWLTLKDVDFVLRLFYIPTPRAASCCESLTSALIPWVLLCALCDDTFTVEHAMSSSIETLLKMLSYVWRSAVLLFMQADCCQTLLQGILRSRILI